jgi:hypothetical protein
MEQELLIILGGPKYTSGLTCISGLLYAEICPKVRRYNALPFGVVDYAF